MSTPSLFAALPLLLVALTPAASAAQSFGAVTSPTPAGATDGPNLLCFGNSYTFSSTNPLVNSPSWPGAVGIPELVRQIALAAGHPGPFVKIVWSLGRGYDWHVDPTKPSLAEIDEPLLDGETWTHVVLQGYSTRSTDHPYLGNPAAHREDGLELFLEVREGSTNHALQSPGVVPVLYQTWAREPGHWLYDPSSSWTIGTYIGPGIQSWKGGPVFAGPAEMAAQVRTTYELTRAWIDTGAPGAATQVAPVGDVWEAAGWGAGWKTLYSSDHFHANSLGDLMTSLTIYGTIWGDRDTAAVIASGALDPILLAIGVPGRDAAQIAAWVDATLALPPIPDPPARPRQDVLIDFSAAAGSPAGPEELPWKGRHYNLIADLAGGVLDAVDTRNRPTGIDVVITDAFAGETPGGATGAWNGAVQIGGSRYAQSAQLDSFFVGNGSGFTDDTARIEIRGLDPLASYRIGIHGSRSNQSNERLGFYAADGKTAQLNAAFNLNLNATLAPVRPDAGGVLVVDVSNGGFANDFAYVNVLEITKLGPDVAREKAPVRPAAGVGKKP